MKKIILACSLACSLLVLGSVAWAVPVGNSNLGTDYLIGGGTPGFLSAGVFGGQTKRDIQNGLLAMQLDSMEALAYVGLDVLPWFTVYGAAGMAEHKLDMSERADAEPEYEVGVSLNIYDQEVMDPTLFEDRIRINASAGVGFSQARWCCQDVSWREFMASVTLSVVNDCHGNKRFVPESIALYVGPAYSDLDSDDLDEDEQIGLVGGLEVFMTESTSFDLGVRHFDGTGFTGGLHVRF